MSSELRRAPGQLLILSAPSGAGKTTLARRFLAECPDAAFSISATTRAPRGQERDGVDYHFVSEAKFLELVERGEFAEWAPVHGHRYGTLRATVSEALAAGRITLFDIDVQGGEALKALWPREAVRIFLLPPSMQELESRLRGRSTDGDETIRRRLAAARAEIQRGGPSYDYLIVNDTIEGALGRLLAVSRHERALLAGSADPALAAEASRWKRGWLDLSRWLG
jgi:guanylate kinase